ncbi:MAG: GFA family protein [Betaproteobacteria bacterium]
MHVSGQCFCGAISFTALIDPARVIVCHCADCQQFSGAPFRAVIPTPVSQVTMTGTPKRYVKTAASGNRRAQAFCPECGTHLFATEADEPKVLNLRVGSLKERAQLAPSVQIWGQSAMPWLSDLTQRPMHGQGLSSPQLQSPRSAEH